MFYIRYFDGCWHDDAARFSDLRDAICSASRASHQGVGEEPRHVKVMAESASKSDDCMWDSTKEQVTQC